MVAGSRPGGVTTSPMANQTIAKPDETALNVHRVCVGNNSINPKSCFNAKGDLKTTTGCSTAGTSVICGPPLFVAADAGKTIYVSNAVAVGVTLKTTIAAHVSPTTVRLSTPAIIPANESIVWATDDTAALQAAFDFAAANNASLYIPSGSYLHHGLNWTGTGGLNTINPPKIFGDAYLEVACTPWP